VSIEWRSPDGLASTDLTFRRWLISLGSCVAVALFCIEYVDHTAAGYIEMHFRHTEPGAALERMFLYADVFVVLPFVFMMACGLWALSGKRTAKWAEIPLHCCWSMVWTVTATLILKHIFGRISSEIWVAGRTDFQGSGFSGFHLLHGNIGYEAFPSGTASITASIVSVVWMLAPKMRPLVALVMVFFATAVVLVNYHYVSDVVAGAFLGATIGYMTVRLQNRE